MTSSLGSFSESAWGSEDGSLVFSLFSIVFSVWAPSEGLTISSEATVADGRSVPSSEAFSASWPSSFSTLLSIVTAWVSLGMMSFSVESWTAFWGEATTSLGDAACSTTASSLNWALLSSWTSPSSLNLLIFSEVWSSGFATEFSGATSLDGFASGASPASTSEIPGGSTLFCSDFVVSSVVTSLSTTSASDATEASFTTAIVESIIPDSAKISDVSLSIVFETSSCTNLAKFSELTEAASSTWSSFDGVCCPLGKGDFSVSILSDVSCFGAWEIPLIRWLPSGGPQIACSAPVQTQSRISLFWCFSRSTSMLSFATIVSARSCRASSSNVAELDPQMKDSAPSKIMSNKSFFVFCCRSTLDLAFALFDDENFWPNPSTKGAPGTTFVHAAFRSSSTEGVNPRTWSADIRFLSRGAVSSPPYVPFADADAVSMEPGPVRPSEPNDSILGLLGLLGLRWP